MLNFYVTNNEYAQAHTYYEDLQALTIAYPNNEQIKVQRAEADLALFDCYLGCEQWDQAQACYENLKSLSATYIQNERIYLLQSLGAYYLTTY